jgi:hypothetical protein
MAIRKSLICLALAAFLLPSLSFAQHGHKATVLMRNGDRVSGQVEGHENGVLYVRVSLHDQQKLNIRDIALIDYVGGASGLPETELSAARGADHVVVLRDGTSLRGRFVDLSHGQEAADKEGRQMLSFRTTAGEDRQLQLYDVSRVYLGNFPAAATAQGAQGATERQYTTGEDVPPGAIRVPGNQQWTPTGMNVRKGDRLAFNVTGRIQLSDDVEDVAHAAGSLRERRAQGAPLPQNFAGALIARVGNSAPFPIGDVTAPVTMPADGQLFLGINDDEVSDNRGEFTVTITRARR